MPLKIFSYWDRADIGVHQELIDNWGSHFPGYRIVGDEDIAPIIAKRFPQYLELYSKISIPSCRADIARLAGLLEWGGLYIDCSCILKDADGVTSLAGALDEVEVVLFNLAQASRPREPTQIVTLNSMIFARPASGVIRMLLLVALKNLKRHYDHEAFGFIPYHIGLLTGPDHIRDSVLEITDNWRAVKPQFRSTIRIVNEEDAPFQRHVFSRYREGKLHWFNRQNSEPLFER